MTPFVRAARWVLERLAGTFYEGPEPPLRLSEMVDDFLALNPTPDHEEWSEFSRELARESYRVGFVRGYEHDVRDWDRSEIYRQKDPERLADALDPSWRDRPYVEEHDPAPPSATASLSGAGILEAAFRKARRERG